MSDEISTQTISTLENANKNALEKNPAFIKAKQTYDTIVRYCLDFINTNSPVLEFYISRYYYPGDNSIWNKDDLDTYYLSGIQLNTTRLNKYEHIYKFTLTKELEYILVTEGWTRIASRPNASFSLSVKRNSVRFYL